MKKISISMLLSIVLVLGSLASYAGDGPFKKGPIAGWHYSDILKDGKSLYGGYNSSFFVGFFLFGYAAPSQALEEGSFGDLPSEEMVPIELPIENTVADACVATGGIWLGKCVKIVDDECAAWSTWEGWCCHVLDR